MTETIKPKAPSRLERVRDMNASSPYELQRKLEMIDWLSSKIPVSQLRVAEKLAGTYGHLWAGRCSIPETGTVTVDEIYSESAAEEYPMLPDGILAPSLDKSGNIVHKTGSGRLTWVIARNGDVELFIDRPGGVNCLKADVFTKLSGPLKGKILAHAYRTGEFMARHVAALEEALIQLCEADEVKKALAVTWDQTPDREQYEAERRAYELEREKQRKAYEEWAKNNLPKNL